MFLASALMIGCVTEEDSATVENALTADGSNDESELAAAADVAADVLDPVKATYTCKISIACVNSWGIIAWIEIEANFTAMDSSAAEQQATGAYPDGSKAANTVCKQKGYSRAANSYTPTTATCTTARSSTQLRDVVGEPTSQQRI